MKTVKRISAKDTYQIRKEVLRKNIDLPYQFNGDLDESTFHLGVFVNEELSCVASFMKCTNDNKLYQLRGMATENVFKGKGLGSLLLKEAENILKTINADVLWCNAREVAVGFYKKNGFEIEGGIFDINKVGPHFKMKKYIK